MLVKVWLDCEADDEHKYFIRAASEFGIDNVRGAEYCQINLSAEDRRAIEKQLRGIKSQCQGCGSDTHFIENCQEKK